MGEETEYSWQPLSQWIIKIMEHFKEINSFLIPSDVLSQLEHSHPLALYNKGLIRQRDVTL